MSKLLIGTSGWSHDGWATDFYPEGTGKSNYLSYYVSQFNSVEANAPFYRLPSEETITSWRNEASEEFLFSVKGHRRITHYNKLKKVKEPLYEYLSRIRQLEESLQTVFWQFPPNFCKNIERLEQFVQLLPDDQQFAFEFRHESWLCSDIYELLQDHNYPIVWQSSSDFPDDCIPTADSIYIRFHGLTGYRYSYKKSDLEPWASVVKRHLDEGKDAQVYFNNAGGNAAASAQMFRAMLNQD
jgi:uncharacterized protein YecE (DUF72 family)